MLKFKISKLEDVEEAFRGLYEKHTDGAYYLSVDGAVSKDKLDEFRTNNVDLLKKLEAFKDVDPAKISDLLENERKIAEKKLIDAGDIEGLVNQRVASMKQAHQVELDKLTKDLSTSNRQLEVLVIDNAVREQATKLGVAPTAVDDVLLRAKTVFKVENGLPVAKDATGNTIYGTDGQTSMGIGDWIGGLKTGAPHLFGQSSGSGSSHSLHGKGGNGGEKMSASAKIAAGLQSGNSVAIQDY